MRAELDALKWEWDNKLKRAAQRTDQILDQAIKGGKLDELSDLLRQKQRDLQVLLSKKSEIERNLQNSEPNMKDNEITALRQDLQNINKQLLDLLEEKNWMFEELTAQTKELLALNSQIQSNVEETSWFKQELEFLKREFAEKDKILGSLHDEIEEK